MATTPSSRSIARVASERASATWWSARMMATPLSASARRTDAISGRAHLVDAGERLVADEDARRADEGSRELEAPPLPRRQLAGGYFEALGELDLAGGGPGIAGAPVHDALEGGEILPGP